MSNYFKTDHATPEQIALMNKQVLSNPDVQKALADYTQQFGPSARLYGTKATPAALGRVHAAMKAAGLPDNMRLTMGKDGQPMLVDDGGINWGNIVALGLGGVAGGFALAGAAGAGGGTPILASSVAPAAESGGYIGADVAGTAAAAEGGSSILGTAGSLLSKANKIAPILGGMATSGSKANQLRDSLAPGQEGAKLARDKYALEAPSTRLSQSVRSGILNTVQPTSVKWNGPGSGLRGEVPTFEGGYSGALQNIDPQTKALAQEVMRKTLQDQLAGKDDETPFLDQVGKTSTLDKVVGGASTAANLYAGYKKGR